MGKKKNSFNAIGTFTELSKTLEDSTNEILRFYSEELANATFKNKESERKIENSEEEQRVKNQVEALGKFLKTTPLETIVFVALYSVETVSGSAVDSRDLSRFFSINNLDFLPLKGCIYTLLQKGLIRQVERRHREDEYRATSAAEHALMENIPFRKRKMPKPDRYKFCKTISSLIEDRSQGIIDSDELFNLVHEEEERNSHLKLKEVADRLSASVNTKDYNSFSILVQYYAHCKKVLNVPRTCFVPEPNVDSVVIELEKYERDKKPKNEELFVKVVQASFKERRKMLVNNLSVQFKLSKDLLKNLLNELDIKEDARGEILSIDDYINLTDKLEEIL